MSSSSGKTGFTLTEVLVAVGVIFILAAIVVAATGPMREVARQGACASNLMQLHQAVLLYTHDYDDVEEFPSLGPMSGAVARSGAGVLERYVKDKEVYYCPDLPAAVRPMLATSYRWYPVPKDANPNPSPGESGMIAGQQREMERQGSSFPMWICDIHDEVYYQPRDGYVDDLFRQEYVIEISVAGKIYRGRRPYSRGTIIREFEHQ